MISKLQCHCFSSHLLLLGAPFALFILTCVNSCVSHTHVFRDPSLKDASSSSAGLPTVYGGLIAPVAEEKLITTRGEDSFLFLPFPRVRVEASRAVLSAVGLWTNGPVIFSHSLPGLCTHPDVAIGSHVIILSLSFSLFFSLSLSEEETVPKNGLACWYVNNPQKKKK